jgi:hypothetical protein
MYMFVVMRDPRYGPRPATVPAVDSLQRVPGLLLGVEGLAVFAAAVVLYLDADYSVLAIGLLADGAVATQVALIWVAHVGVDRALGYGLKYPSAFKDTHLQRV